VQTLAFISLKKRAAIFFFNQHKKAKTIVNKEM
jgi:hypothetical protein